jgi:hypothetical protein
MGNATKRGNWGHSGILFLQPAAGARCAHGAQVKGEPSSIVIGSIAAGREPIRDDWSTNVLPFTYVVARKISHKRQSRPGDYSEM